jgi:hypothetical protein
MDYINHTNGRHPMETLTITHNWDDTNCAECGIITGEDADWMSTLHGEGCTRRIAPKVAGYVVLDRNGVAAHLGNTVVGIYADAAEAEAKRAERASAYKPQFVANVATFALTEVTR